MKNILMIAALTSVMFSCIKHEVIPPPLPQVDLQAAFSADTNGAQISYVNDVNGFFVTATNFKEINTSPQPSRITYFSQISSSNLQDLFKVSIGRETWDAADGFSPPINQFRIFFENLQSLTSVPFSADGEDGVELLWRDSNNQLWKTDPDSAQPQFFAFTSVSQESDEEGDYVLFTAIFSATFYLVNGSETRTLSNGVFTSYFKNN